MIISIIIPTFNRAHCIGDTLQSIVNQKYTKWECIVVDDGSSDRTEEIVASFSAINPNIYYFKRPKNLPKGPSSCRNFGFFKANGTIVNFFDSDDLYLPTAFENIVKQFTEKCDAVVAKLEVIDFNTKIKIKENKIFSKKLLEDYFTGKIAFYVCGPFWNRSFLDKQTALFDENIKNLDDWDFNLRMLIQNPKIQYVDLVIIQYQYHQNSLSQEINKFNFTEIASEITAREKILKLLKDNKNCNYSQLSIFYSKRCHFFLKEAVLQKHPKKYHLLQKTVFLQIKNLELIKALSTVFGFIIFAIFKKGYKFIK